MSYSHDATPHDLQQARYPINDSGEDPARHSQYRDNVYSYYDPYELERAGDADEQHNHPRRNTSLFVDQSSNPKASLSSTEHSPFLDSESTEPLVKNAAGGSNSTLHEDQPKSRFQNLDYAEAEQQSSPFKKWLQNSSSPLEQRIENKKRGIGRQKYPFLSWILAVIMVAILIYELVRNDQAQGSPISTKPVFNPLIGPSTSALINFGARFPPCMKIVTGIPIDTQFGCLNNTANPPTSLCSLEDICGFGGFHGKAPNQWWRFITPIFLHAGIIHILLNMIAQLLVSAQIEKEMGSGGFFILYFAAGIFGNILGGNFALVGLPSVGASGAIFGTVAATWIDLFAHWRYKYRPVRQLITMIVELMFGIGLGYIPGVDNFAHLGGFFMGLLIATTFYPVVSESSRHKKIIWLCRLACIPVAVVLIVVLLRNFYTGDPYTACSGCRYLSCFPTKANNHCKGTGLTINGSSL